jgi:Flp pilus assembly protein TadG
MKCYQHRRLVKRLRDARGNSMVEAAIITPLLLFLTFAIVDFATAFYAYLALENGVSQALRFGITGNLSGDLNHEESIKKAMRDATPFLTIEDGDFTFSHLTPGEGDWEPGTGDPNDISKVTVNYEWALMTPIVRELFPAGAFNIRVESAMKNEPRFE